MEEAVSKLTIEFLSQPLILIFVIIGSLGLLYSIIKNVKYYVVNIILFVLIVSLVGAIGKEIQTIAFGISIILITIFCIFFIIVKTKEHNKKVIIRKKLTYDTAKDNICPKCGEILKERSGRYGKFWGCSNYPNCKFVRKIDEKHDIAANMNITENKNLESTNIDKCPKCGGNLILKNGKYGSFYGCSNYPNCKYTKN